jgi:hypothetical protein
LQHTQYPDEALENNSETPETWLRLQLCPTLWGTAVANKQRLDAVEREDGSMQVAGRGEERCVEAVTMDHAASARRTRRRTSGEWRWGDRKTGGGAQALCSNAVALEHAATMRARRVGSRMDAGTTSIREEGESGIFLE